MIQPDAPVSEKARAALRRMDAETRDCPARQRWLGDQSCPKCGADRSEGCRREIAALHDFARDIRAILDGEAG